MLDSVSSSNETTYTFHLVHVRPENIKCLTFNGITMEENTGTTVKSCSENKVPLFIYRSVL